MEPSLSIGIGPPRAISGQRKPSLSIWNETRRSATPTLRSPERLDLIGGSGLLVVGVDRPGAWPRDALGVHRLELAAGGVNRPPPVQASFMSIAQAPISACAPPNTRVRRLAGTAASSRSVRSPRGSANFRASAWSRSPGVAPTAALPEVPTPWRRLPSGRLGVVADPCGTPAEHVAPVQPRCGLCSQSVFVQRGQPNRQRLGDQEDGCSPRPDALVVHRLQPVPCAQRGCGGVRSQAKETQSNRPFSVATGVGIDRGRRWLEAHLGPRGESRRLANDRFGRPMLDTWPRRHGVDRAAGESTRRSHHHCVRKATTGLPVLPFPLSPSLRGQTIRPNRSRCCWRLHVDAASLGNAGQHAANSPIPG